MDIYELINNRFSVNSYKSDVVPLEVINKVIDAALMATSWGNKQCWRIIIVDKKVEKSIIGKAAHRKAIAKACEEAPYVLVLCADPEESEEENDIEYYVFDSGLAMENLILAAFNEGLGTRIVGHFNEEIVKAAVNLPEHIKVVAFTPLGYINDTPMEKNRRDRNEIVFINQWGDRMDI